MDALTPIEEIFATEDEIRREVWAPHFRPKGWSESMAERDREGNLRCRASVPDGGRSVLSHQCGNRGAIEEGGYYWCRIHHPTAMKRKRVERDRQWRREYEERRERETRADALRTAEKEIIALARGCLKQEASFDALMTAVEKYESLLAKDNPSGSGTPT